MTAKTAAHPSLTAVLAARDALGGRPDANLIAMRHLATKVAECRALPSSPDWPPPDSYPSLTEAAAMVRHLAAVDVTGWDMADLGAAYEYLMSPDDRKGTGAWYTPPEVAGAMCGLSIGPQLERLAREDDPAQVLTVTAVDPACGAGVFLVAASRLITQVYCEREFGSTAPELLAAVMPDVMQECVFGMDIDPVAVDLARFALWMECGGRPGFGWMDRNVCVVNPLSAPDAVPPALAGQDERWTR
jgi:N-6 DNA Methylase